MVTYFSSNFVLHAQSQVVNEGQVLCFIEQLGGEVPIEVLSILFIWKCETDYYFIYFLFDIYIWLCFIFLYYNTSLRCVPWFCSLMSLGRLLRYWGKMEVSSELIMSFIRKLYILFLHNMDNAWSIW